MSNRGIAGLEIYFEDLTPEAQRALLDYEGVDTVEETKYAELPIVIVE